MTARPWGTIGVLMGGYSSEREISLRSGQGVARALADAGHTVKPIDITEEDSTKIAHTIQSAGIDVAFIALHGRLGEDGVIQNILEGLNIPYTGSGVKASQMAYNKILAQKAFKAAGLPVPEHYLITDGKNVDFKTVWAHLRSTPVVIKPACEGSSFGVHVVRHPAEWEPALKDAFSYGPQVIVEQFIKGRELTAGILGQEPLPLVEICLKANFFNFTAKYQKGLTQYICPADITESLAKKIQALALRAYQTLGCEGFSRVDLRLDDDNRPYILEINTIPGFTETSLLPKAAQVAGKSFTQICEGLIDLAYGKKNKH